MLTYETFTQELIYRSDIFSFNMEYVCMADFERTRSRTNKPLARQLCKECFRRQPRVRLKVMFWPSMLCL